jgi:serine/threonine protein kinase
MITLEEAHQRVLQSKLLTDEDLVGHLFEWRAAASEYTDGDAFLAWLVGRNQLTEFQAEALAAGMTGPFMLGPYRVQEHIIGGRLGHVFRAIHVDFDQPVGLKVFPQALQDDPEKLARMQREARVAIQVDHPHVMRTFQIGRVGKIYFLAFEDLQGESLATRLARQGRLEYPEACRLIRQAALGLESLHQADIVHRDLRPDNLWITRHGQLKIMEFGAARDSLSFLDAPEEGEPGPLAMSSAVLGNCDYLAPEQAHTAQAADARSDIYALGCCLYHALAGQPPFVEQNVAELMARHAHEPPQLVNWLVPHVPQPLAEVVARMLAKSPDARYQTAGEVDWALTPYIEHGSTDLAQATDAEWNPDYLAWVRSLKMADTLSGTAAAVAVAETMGEQAAGISGDFSDFLDWISEKKTAPPSSPR